MPAANNPSNAGNSSSQLKQNKQSNPRVQQNPKQKRQPVNPVPSNRNGQARSTNNKSTKNQPTNQSPPKQSNGKSKLPTATGPNYTETKGVLYKIGTEFDARNHMGWRRNEKNGSSVQFLFKPKMASRVDQAYYRIQNEDDSKYVQTFAVGVFVQDSSLARNAILTPKNLQPDEKNAYLQHLSDAFNAILARTKIAFDTDSQPTLVINA
ncbi:ORF2b [Alphamesonivirus daknongense]|uniref:ORF2b n=1 Tax=Alphamesonivirus daknongense TaxID=1945561 RepID=M4JWT0_9NIDO|nr:ORF2b [Alphamesonivirus 3]AGE00058.1 ORF2b [Alphamesonivirus 3]